MPLTSKGEEIKEKMEHEYGSKKGEEVFYASRNKGTISGVDGVGMECADQPGISPYYGDPPLDPTSIAPPPNSNVEQPSGMAEPVDNSTFNPPPLGDGKVPPPEPSQVSNQSAIVALSHSLQQLRSSGADPAQIKRTEEAIKHLGGRDAEMNPTDAFAAIGAQQHGDAWSRMTGNRDFSGDEHSGMGRLPREVSFKQMRGMAEGFGYNQGNQGDPYKK